MKLFSISLFLLSIHSPHFSDGDGSRIPEPALTDYIQGNRSPGILAMPEEVQDAEGNPATL